MKNLLKDDLLSIAQTLRENGQIALALEVLGELLRQDPGHPAARFQRALCLLTMGFFGPGWTDYEKRLHDHPLARHLGRPIYTDSKLIVHGEQGIGDEIMFAGLFHDLYCERGERFTCVADSRLHYLFAHSFPYLTVSPVDSRESKTIELSDRDTLIMSGSLGRMYRGRIQDFPPNGGGYLKPEPVRLEFFKSIMSNSKLNVGLAWRGGIVETGRFRRSLSFAELRPLMVDGVQFFNLQHDAHPGEFDRVTFMGGRFLDIASGMWQDWLELATFVSALDLVITVQSSIVHLCGALGVPCWALVPAAPEWRYGMQGERMPWYSSVKLYRQHRLGDWAPVLNRVRTDLLERAVRV